jgi:integrase
VLLTPQHEADIADQLSRVRALEREMGIISPWLFVHLRGPHRGKHIRAFDRRWQRMCREAGCGGMLRYDLGRTAAREMVGLGMSEKVIMQIGGWKTRSMFDRHYFMAERDLRDATRRLTGTDRARTIGDISGHKHLG